MADDDIPPPVVTEVEVIHKNEYLKERKAYEKFDERTLHNKEQLKKRKELTSKNYLEICEEEKEGIERRLEDSDKELASLLRDGAELVTNIRIANDKREVDRRIKEAELRDELLLKLQQESIEASEKFSKISNRWVELGSLRDPMELNDGLEHQKKRINELLKEKDDIIEECRKELQAADDRYYYDQEKQSADIYCLVERIDQQIDIMKKAYKEHLILLQNTIDQERETLWTQTTRKWEQMYQFRNENEEMKLKTIQEKSNFYSMEMERITMEHEELIRATRIRLESDNQCLLLELENVKANVMLNSEKLDYNYQVLKKREEENIMIRNQQKRRLTNLNETIQQLHNKIQETKTNGNFETAKLTKEVKKLHETILQLESKADMFADINNKKYENVWDANFDEAKELLNKVLDIDKILYEQQLGLDWQPPSTTLLEKKMLPSYNEAYNFLKKDDSYKSEQIRVKKLNEAEIKQKLKNKIDKNNILRIIMRKIANRAGFLVEDKLTEILKGFTDEQRTLVRIDNVINALGISNMSNIQSLLDHFLPYTYCPNCLARSKARQNERIQKIINVERTGGSVVSESSVISQDRRSINEKVLKFFDQNDDLDSEIAELVPHFTDQKAFDNDLVIPDTVDVKEEEIETNLSAEKCQNHYLVLDTCFILPALREYSEAQDKKDSLQEEIIITMTSRLSRVRSTISRLLHPRDVQQFWNQFLKIFPKKKEKLWQSLEYGLNEYLVVLKEREKLDNECEALRRQNLELKHLLQKYLPNKDCLCND